CGKPVVAHRSGGTVETVGKVGVLCGDDLEEWVRNVKHLMENENERKSLGEKAFRFSKEFTWENTVKQISETLEKLIEDT
ncbi:MAG: glycosyltransferase, partial [Candidatus Bathyarchaeia archaeon]